MKKNLLNLQPQYGDSHIDNYGLIGFFFLCWAYRDWRILWQIF